jgi:hypothetical protein
MIERSNPVSHVIVFAIVILVPLIAGLAWVWLVARPQTARYRHYRQASSESSRRNRAWDAAVARARDR